jgi:hypothetical protein
MSCTSLIRIEHLRRHRSVDCLIHVGFDIDALDSARVDVTCGIENPETETMKKLASAMCIHFVDKVSHIALLEVPGGSAGRRAAAAAKCRGSGRTVRRAVLFFCRKNL